MRRELAATLCLLLAGCASASPSYVDLNGPHDPDRPDTWSYAELIDTAIAHAQAIDGAEEQVVLLEAARERGEVTYGDMLAGLNTVAECITDAGATIHDRYDGFSFGQRYPVLTYSIPSGMTEIQFDLIYDECDVKGQAALRDVYSDQPSGRRQTAGEAIAEYGGELRACLAEMGVAGTESLTAAELWDELKRQEFAPGDYGYGSSRHCWNDITGLTF